MSDQKPTILAQAEAMVEAEIEPLADDEKAALSVTGGNHSQRIGGAVDLGKGFSAGGHVEHTEGEKVGWFAGLTKKWKKR